MLRKKCRYWPEIHHVDVATGVWKQIAPISPGKWQQVVRQSRGQKAAYIDNVNLQRSFLHGPFNFTHTRARIARTHQIHSDHWNALERSAAAHGIETSDVNKIIPL